MGCLAGGGRGRLEESGRILSDHLFIVLQQGKCSVFLTPAGGPRALH
jgi:hypothetical protein